MKIKLILFLLLSMPAFSFTMEGCKMPSAKVLEQRLRDAGFDHFIEKTAIVKELAEQTKPAIAIVT